MIAAAAVRRAGLALAAAGMLIASGIARSAPDIGYDSHANAQELVAAAVERAAAEHKLVLVVAGGDWCIWCHYLHAFFDAHANLDAALHDTFVVAKVYYGDENRNEALFATLPKAAGYPHFWVLSSDGRLLESQQTVLFEDGKKSYDEAKLGAFVASWNKRRDG